MRTEERQSKLSEATQLVSGRTGVLPSHLGNSDLYKVNKVESEHGSAAVHSQGDQGGSLEKVTFGMVMRNQISGGRPLQELYMQPQGWE